MPRRTRRFAMLLAGAMLAAMLPGATLAAGGTIVEVNDSNLTHDWFFTPLADGTGEFAAGPADPPYGTGSFHMSTSTMDGKSTLITTNQNGAPLADLTGIDYHTYRDGSSSSPSYIAPSINVAIFTNVDGPGTGFATLVFEPLYSYGNDAVQDDIWQWWDTTAPTQTGFAGGWWTTRDVGSICAFTCYTTLADLQAQAPDATILGIGVNVGRGPASFVGAVDGLSLTMAGSTTTYDFEFLALDKDGCKDGGWQHDQVNEWKNQGDCVSFYASAKRQGPKDDVLAAKAERRAAREAARAEKTQTARTKSTAATSKAPKDSTTTASGGKASGKAKSDAAKSKSTDKGKSQGKGKGG